MQEITKQEFDKAFNEVLGNEIHFVSYSKAGKGFKRIVYIPLDNTFIVYHNGEPVLTTVSGTRALDRYRSINI